MSNSYYLVTAKEDGSRPVVCKFADEGDAAEHANETAVTSNAVVTIDTIDANYLLRRFEEMELDTLKTISDRSLRESRLDTIRRCIADLVIEIEAPFGVPWQR